MPENPKDKKDKAVEPENPPENPPEDKPETGDEDSWSRAQREKSYYYDDAHGYEIYNPDEDDEDEDEEYKPSEK